MLRSQPFGSNEARLLVEPDVLARLAVYRQMKPNAREAGGILLGFRRGEHLHVSEATEPQAVDIRSRFGFHRRAKHHQAIALERWAATGRKMDYLGEWHTHPEHQPVPSGIDVRHWREICQTRTVPMVFIILGMSDVWVGIGLNHDIRPTAEPSVHNETEY